MRLGIDAAAGGAALLVLVLAWRGQPRRRLPAARGEALAVMADRRPDGHAALRAGVGEPPDRPLRTVRQWVGWFLFRVLDRLLCRAGATRPAPRRDPFLLSRVGGVALALGTGALLEPFLAPVLALAAWWAPAFEQRRAKRRYEASVAACLPETVDLLLLSLTSGANVSHALQIVTRRSSGPLAAELSSTLAEVAEGRRLSDALDDLPRRAGEPVRGLSTALTSSERYGVSLNDALERLADEVRSQRRRAAEERARKVPVKMLFPLVCCTLPAFGLLTIAPLIASALRSLRR